MTFSSNTQKLFILGFVLFVSIAFNACGNSLQDEVTISTDPDNPEVVKVDLPEDDDFDGAVAPWFIFDYLISNGSDRTFVLTRLELVSNRLGDDSATNTEIIEASALEDGEGYDEFSLAIAVVDPESEWQSSNNAGAIVNGERQGLVWYVDSLPVDANQSREQQSTLYEVNATAIGFFVPNDDDDVVVYERSFRFFTE